MNDQYLLSFLAGLGIVYLCLFIYDVVYFLMRKFEKASGK
jgi:hypothetical protein